MTDVRKLIILSTAIIGAGPVILEQRVSGDQPASQNEIPGSELFVIMEVHMSVNAQTTLFGSINYWWHPKYVGGLCSG